LYRRLLLLGLLRQREMHGYRLNDFIDRFLHICSDLKRPTAYFLLDKMAQEGLVRESVDREGRYPERKVYSITPEGETHFLDLLRENLAGFDRTRYPGDIGLAFVHELPPGERVALLAERRERILAELAWMDGVPPHGGSIDLVMDRNQMLLRSELAWLESAISRVEAIRGMREAGPTTCVTAKSTEHGTEDGA
jgi:DNA-binding PadR family transcriptional regulator